VIPGPKGFGAVATCNSARSIGTKHYTFVGECAMAFTARKGSRKTHERMDESSSVISMESHTAV
jgi:hypothetical protein